MAKAKSTNESRKVTFGAKRKRPGVHSKTKTSRNKRGSNYKKRYRGQGR